MCKRRARGRGIGLCCGMRGSGCGTGLRSSDGLRRDIERGGGSDTRTAILLCISSRLRSFSSPRQRRRQPRMFRLSVILLHYRLIEHRTRR